MFDEVCKKQSFKNNFKFQNTVSGSIQTMPNQLNFFPFPEKETNILLQDQKKPKVVSEKS